ncbi:DUF4083 family protein [Alkalihalobacterium chitinilyticum]|uniref:DUF4083 family protein n=1 Tax=Alkalihalobacterium chitinilyticum TaxID=2980103 RepID=A0ABT5VDH7_9BACI|nr:DUF4083 family protein [Alkalihalobacterium chitinilyticum]MDE5413310.1 DUF4083 family protein [Alkalihalobacterium chitinilyticum]
MFGEIQFNVFDAIFQLLSLAVLIGIIMLIVFFIRTTIENKKRVKRMEEKMEDILQKLEKKQS